VTRLLSPQPVVAPLRLSRRPATRLRHAPDALEHDQRRAAREYHPGTSRPWSGTTTDPRPGPTPPSAWRRARGSTPEGF